MLRQSAEAKNAKQAEEAESRQLLAEQIKALQVQVETIQQARGLDELSATVEPLAKALAALSDNTGKALLRIDERALQASKSFSAQLKGATSATTALEEATARAQTAAAHLRQAAGKLDRGHYVLAISVAVATGVVSAALVSVFWLLLYPPTVTTEVDPKVVAEIVKAAEAARPAPVKPARSK